MAKRTGVRARPASDQRAVRKVLRQFARREFTEKRLQEVDVREVGSKTVFQRGVLPEISVSLKGPVRFVVVVPGRSHHRCYFFDARGSLLGADNVDQEGRRALEKHTKRLFHLHREKPKPDLVALSERANQSVAKLAKTLKRLTGKTVSPPMVAVADHASVSRELGEVDSEYQQVGYVVGGRGRDRRLVLSHKYVDTPLARLFLFSHLLRDCLSLDRIAHPDEISSRWERVVDGLVRFLTVAYQPEGTSGVAVEWWEATTTPWRLEGFRIEPTKESDRVRAAVTTLNSRERRTFIRGVTALVDSFVDYGLRLSALELFVFHEFCVERVAAGVVWSPFEVASVAADFVADLLQFEVEQGFSPARLRQLVLVQTCLTLVASAETDWSLIEVMEEVEDVTSPVVPHLGPEGNQFFARWKELADGLLLDTLKWAKERFEEFDGTSLLASTVRAYFERFGLIASMPDSLRLPEGSSAEFSVQVQNMSDVPLLDFQLVARPVPRGRFHVEEVERSGPIDLHRGLEFHLSGFTTSAGKATVTLSARFRDPVLGASHSVHLGVVKVRVAPHARQSHAGTSKPTPRRGS
ncbi:MAG: hypothetical protein Kow0069_12820 [Promethearchaeota archaeon]